MTVRASDIADFLGKSLVGEDVDIRGPGSLNSASPGDVLFINDPDFSDDKIIGGLSRVLVLVPREYAGLSVPHIRTDKPRLDFVKALRRFFDPAPDAWIAPTAVVEEGATIGSGVTIGHFSVIETGVSLGEGTRIGAHVVIRQGTRIGAHCRIGSNTVIGETGFGFEFDEQGRPLRFPHSGGVVLGDHVEIGALVSIARGSLDDTVLSSYVKVDDQVFIAHNVHIGENTVLIAGAEISGSVKIGSDCWIGPNSCLIDRIEIRDRVLVGMGSVVTKPVEAGVVVCGNPAKVLRKNV